jgi:hypothetical protein
LNEFNFTCSSQLTEKYFSKNLPKFYAIVTNEFLQNKHKILYDVSFSQKIFLLKNDYKMPKCKIKKCKNTVDLCKNASQFHMCCKEHDHICGRSKKEIAMFNFIKNNYDGEIITNYKINGKNEIDVYLPDLNLGFEFNGIKYHSIIFKSKDYHLNKHIFYKEKNIELIFIWENNWDYKQQIVKSFIKHKLNKNKTLELSNCNIKHINGNIKKKFIDKNYLDDDCISSINLALYNNDEIVYVMTFKKLKKDNEYMILRMCNRLNLNVKGANASLLNYFINQYKPTKILMIENGDLPIDKEFK